MKNFAEQIQGVNNKCMAIEDEACASVDGFSKPNADIMKEIEAEEKERERTEQKNAAKIQLQKDSYQQESEAIELRHDRAIADAKADRLKAITKENDAYKAGGVDTKEHQSNLRKIEEDFYKAQNKAEDARRTALENLRMKNPEGYRRVRGW
jgi:hypothetical protein